MRDRRAVAAARRLPHELTDAERLLWARLRRDQIGISIRRQHPIGAHIVDFYAPEIRLAVELDGGQHAVRTTADEARTGELLAADIGVLRFWNSEVLGNMPDVLSAISAVVEALRTHTSPLTPLRSGGRDAGGRLSALGLRLSLPEGER